MRRIIVGGALATPLLVYINRESVEHAFSNWNAHVAGIASCIIAIQALVGAACVLISMPHRWSMLHRGEIQAGQEPAITHAGWAAAVADARHKVMILNSWPYDSTFIRKWVAPEQVVGARIDTDFRWRIVRLLDRLARTPRGWFTHGWVTLPRAMPRALVLAESGHGKTVALTSMVLAALVQDARVVMIDCKGSADDAATLRTQAEQLGKRVVRWPETPLDLWTGDAHACVSIVKSMLPVHPYWQTLGEAVLVAISRHAGPWRSTEELFDRLRNPAAHVSDRNTLVLITQRVSGGQPAHLAIYQMVFAKLGAINNLIDGGNAGFVTIDDEDVDLLIISADCGADTRLGTAVSAFIADINAYRIGRRTDSNRHLLIAIDEVQVLLAMTQPPDLCWLAEQCRGQRIGLLIATQSHAGLGTSADRLLGAGMSLWIGRMADPTALIHSGGTRMVVEMGWQKAVRRFTGTATARTQHAFRIDPNRVRVLPTWAWCVVSEGRIGNAYVPPVHLLHETLRIRRCY